MRDLRHQGLPLVPSEYIRAAMSRSAYHILGPAGPARNRFFWTVTGRQEAASVLSLLQTALVIAGHVAARLLLGRAPRQSALRDARDAASVAGSLPREGPMRAVGHSARPLHGRTRHICTFENAFKNALLLAGALILIAPVPGAIAPSVFLSAGSPSWRGLTTS